MRINCITFGAANSSKRNYIASDQKSVADIVSAQLKVQPTMSHEMIW